VDRRAFVATAAGLLVAPLVADAQQSGTPVRLGVLAMGAPAWAPDSAEDHRALVAGLQDQGYVVGQNLVIEFRSALGKVGRFPDLAAELVRLGVKVVVTGSEPGITAVRAASPTLAIVMAGASPDPVASGFVASLARPGGNVTGVTLGDLAGKRLELLREALPRLRSVVAFHGDPTFPFVAQWLRTTETAARRLGLSLHPVHLPGGEPERYETVFEAVKRRGIDAATIHESGNYETHRERLADLALRHRLPMVFTFSNQAQAGGLMAYTIDQEEIFRRAGSLAARILKGAKPADLPVEEPTRYQFVLNLKTAKALGVIIPPSVLARATDVIE
jgi:ABC-type uncharacterized transport system substrate-binding protein